MTVTGWPIDNSVYLHILTISECRMGYPTRRLHHPSHFSQRATLYGSILLS